MKSRSCWQCNKHLRLIKFSLLSRLICGAFSGRLTSRLATPDAVAKYMLLRNFLRWLQINPSVQSLALMPSNNSCEWLIFDWRRNKTTGLWTAESLHLLLLGQWITIVYKLEGHRVCFQKTPQFFFCLFFWSKSRDFCLSLGLTGLLSSPRVSLSQYLILQVRKMNKNIQIKT